MSTEELEHLADQMDRVGAAPSCSPPSHGLLPPLAWAVSATLHIAVVAGGVALWSTGSSRDPARPQYARGEQVVANVRLLSSEEFEQLWRPLSSAARAIAQEPAAAPQEPPPAEAPALISREPKALPLESQPAAFSAPESPPPAAQPPDAQPVRLETVQPLGSPQQSIVRQRTDGEPEAATPLADSSTQSNEANPASRGVTCGVELLHRCLPEYPAASLRAREEGLVVLLVEVAADGAVGQIDVLEDPGFPRLVQAAIDAARRTKFRPGMEDGRHVMGKVEVPYRFRIKKRG